MLTPGDDRTLAHARAIRARGMAMPPDGLPPQLILDSWVRCMDVGLLPTAGLAVPVVEAAELLRRRERSEFVRRLAQAELETLSRQIAGSNFLLAFADQEGVILDLYADNRFSMSGSDAGILPGSVWTESVAGTNGLGTALAAGTAVAVTGLDHYFLKLGDISCTAAPVRDAHGQVVGVLDASSYYESRQRHTQALVQMAATHIENSLLAHQMRGQWVLAIHPRAEFLGTLSTGLLAFDGQGVLVAVNGPAHHLLSGLEVVRGTRFEELFGEPLDHVLARLHLGTDARLRDALGSVLVVRLVGQAVGPARGHVLHNTSPQRLPTALPAAPNALASRPSRTAREPRPSGHSRLDESGAGAARAGAAALDFLADDPVVQEACRVVEAAVRLNAPILLQGETGTGKELLARYAHQVGGRRGEFVAVNCAALPGELFEAELFGHVGGAFTGARRDGSPGLLLAADGGTLLLDEVRDLPLHLQAALLRFLDDQMVRPVGGQTARRVNVQLLAACHASLDEAVLAKTFRADLLHRLNTVCVTLPALRQRRDLAQAARWVLGQIDPQQTLADDALASLLAHNWPGNFRELRSVLTRSLLHRPAARSRQPLSAQDIGKALPQALPLASTSQLQRGAADLVRAEFERCGHSVSLTARALGISRTTVYRHLRS